MEKQKFSLEESEELNRRLNQKLQELDDTIGDVSRLASQLMNYPAMALTTREAVTIVRFDLIYVDANTFIIVVMLSDHTVRNKLVRLPISVDEKMIRKLATLFNANFTHIAEDAITTVIHKPSFNMVGPVYHDTRRKERGVFSFDTPHTVTKQSPFNGTEIHV